MALLNKRIIDLPERSALNSDDYTVVDGSNGGTSKYKLSQLQDDVGEAKQGVTQLSQTVTTQGQQIATNTSDIADLKADLNQSNKNTIEQGEYITENLFNVSSEYTATVIRNSYNPNDGTLVNFSKTACTLYAQSIREPLALRLLNDNWRVAVYWYKGADENNEYLGRTTYWHQNSTLINFDYEAKANGYFGIAKNVRIVFFRWNGTDIVVDGADVTSDEISNFANNYSFEHIAPTSTEIINAGKQKTDLLIAPSDASDNIKKYADYVCTGANDELVIQEAVSYAGVNNMNVLFACGNFYIDSFPWNDVTGVKVAIAVGKGTTARTASSTIELRGCGYGSLRKFGTNSEFFKGAIFNIRESTYNQLDSNTQYAIIAGVSNTSGARIYPTIKTKVKNIAFKIEGNQKKIICIDGWNMSALSLDNIGCMAITVNSGSTSGNIPAEDLIVAVDGCIAIRGLQGSCYGINNVWKDVFVWGFHTGFHVIGEHIIGLSLGARFCNYGYVFGATGNTWEGTLAHPNTLINCCDECNFNMPLFGKGGRANATGKQAVNLIDYNLEWFDEYAALGGDLAKEVEVGCAYGDITFTSVRYYGTSYTNAPFWASGHGHNFKTRNSLHAVGGTTSLRNTYTPMYMQEYYDTDLNKLLIYDGTNWRDTSGTVI